MAFQRVPDTAEIILEGLMGGQQIINTFYGHMEGGYAIADVEALATDVDTWVLADWLPNMPSNYEYVRTTVRGLNAAIDLIATANANAGPGEALPSTLSNNASFSVKRSSGFTGRGARGRVFLPPPTASFMLDDNHVSPAGVSAFHAALVGLDAVISGAGWIPVMVHRVEAGVPLAVAVVFTVVEWIVVDNVIDSMRRRLPKRGV